MSVSFVYTILTRQRRSDSDGVGCLYILLVRRAKKKLDRNLNTYEEANYMFLG